MDREVGLEESYLDLCERRKSDARETEEKPGAAAPGF